MIRTLQSLCEKSRCPSESKVFICSFETMWHRHKKVQGLSTYPSSTVSTFGEHLMLLGMNFMAHSAVWGHPPIQRQNTNSKKLMIEKLPKSSLRRCTKFGQPHSNDERKITLLLILHFIEDCWI